MQSQEVTGAEAISCVPKSEVQNQSHRSSNQSLTSHRQCFPPATSGPSMVHRHQLLLTHISSQPLEFVPRTTAGCGIPADLASLTRQQASNASCTLGAVFCGQDNQPTQQAEEAIPTSISPDNFSATAQRSASASGTILRVPAEGQDGFCPHSSAPEPQPTTSLKRTNSNVSGPFGPSKKPRPLHLHGDDTDDGKLLQVRPTCTVFENCRKECCACVHCFHASTLEIEPELQYTSQVQLFSPQLFE
jgi:hypothetical protein